jgi:hypothetical protein
MHVDLAVVAERFYLDWNLPHLDVFSTLRMPHDTSRRKRLLEMVDNTLQNLYHPYAVFGGGASTFFVSDSVLATMGNAAGRLC